MTTMTAAVTAERKKPSKSNGKWPASEPVIFQVWRWNKITDFIPKLLDFEIGVNLTVDFIPNG